jgi:carbonic anhydrase/acetyltransferase-like protein (isoleucine patch superfamily)
VVGSNSVIRHNSVVENCEVPHSFYIPSTANIKSNKDLDTIERITPDVANFSESVTQANKELVKGYKRIRNEF